MLLNCSFVAFLLSLAIDGHFSVLNCMLLYPVEHVLQFPLFVWSLFALCIDLPRVANKFPFASVSSSHGYFIVGKPLRARLQYLGHQSFSRFDATKFGWFVLVLGSECHFTQPHRIEIQE
jgi:hypothetical protein